MSGRTHFSTRMNEVVYFYYSSFVLFGKVMNFGVEQNSVISLTISFNQLRLQPVVWRLGLIPNQGPNFNNQFPILFKEFLHYPADIPKDSKFRTEFCAFCIHENNRLYFRYMK